MGPCWTLPATVVVQHVSVLSPAGAAKWSVAECPGILRLTASQPVPQGKLRVESLSSLAWRTPSPHRHHPVCHLFNYGVHGTCIYVHIRTYGVPSKVSVSARNHWKYMHILLQSTQHTAPMKSYMCTYVQYTCIYCNVRITYGMYVLHTVCAVYCTYVHV